MSNPTPPAESAAEFGAALRRSRKRQGLTQAELADLAGVGTRFVSELERGKDTVELARALRVLAACGVDVYVVDRSDGDG